MAANARRRLVPHNVRDDVHHNERVEAVRRREAWRRCRSRRVMAQTECSFSAYFVAAAFFLSVAFAYGSEDCD